MYSSVQHVYLGAVIFMFLTTCLNVLCRPSRGDSSDTVDFSGVAAPPRPAVELDNTTERESGRHAHAVPLNRTRRIDPAKFRGATGRHTRSGGYIDNGMGGMGTALLLQQMMAQNAAAQNGNCSDSAPKPGMDMQAMLPMIMAMQNQGTYRGGYSG